ncbi:MAG: hypothetical protein JXR95_04460 [Deltaproteobacteria bacterium]|nr:hypothetical protein [Deltaproteobacteria bacterium]
MKITEFLKVSFLGFFILNIPFNVYAKNCPSRLNENLHQVGEKELYWGMELRLANYFIWEKDATASDSSAELLKNGFAAVRGVVDYTIEETFGGSLNLVFEGELKQRKSVENCNSWAVPTFKDFELIPQLRKLYGSWEGENTKISVGRQNFTYGTQALIDNFFDAFKLEYKSETLKTSFQLFSGVFANELARETLGCGYEQYYENRRAWKRLCTANYGDYIATGAVARFKFAKPHQISVMNLLQLSLRDRDMTELNPEYPEKLTTDFLSVYAIGPFFTEKLYYETELIGALRIDGMKPMFGVVGGFQYKINAPGGHIVLNPRYSGSFLTEDNLHFASIFESFDLGSRQRYGLYDGHVYSFAVRYKIHSFRLHTAYHYHLAKVLSEVVDDELEAGVTWFIGNKSKYQLRLIYSGINIAAGDLPVSHGIRAVARIVF